MHKACKLSVYFSSRIHRAFLTTQSEPVFSSPVPTQEKITRLILEQKSATEALQTFRWASELRNFTHNQSTYRALIHKLCSSRRFDTAQEMLDEMLSSIGSTPDEDIFITIIRGLGRARMIKQVVKVPELVFKFEKKPTLKLYNSILDVLVKEDIDIAREFYRMKMMGSGIQGDDYTYGILMKGLCLTNRIGDGFKLLQVMKTRGITPNTVIYNTLIHALCKNGKVGRARSLMREFVEPSDVTFNILISAYCGERNFVQALVMLEKSFSKGYIPDVITVTKVVELLCNDGRASEAVEVLESVEERGGIVDVVAYNTLINGFCRLGNVKVGCRLLKEMELKGCLPNADTYNGLISGLCDSKMLNLALDMFNEMKRVGIKWNFVTYDTLIHGLCSSGRVEDGLKILELMEDDKRASAFHISPYNGIIYGLYKQNRLEEALAFLMKMENLYPRAVDRSMKIHGFCENGSIDEARRVYDQMVGEGIMPSALIYANLISGFCSKGYVREAFELMNEMIGHGYLPVASTFNALINLLCRQGRVGKASKLMEDIIGRGCLLDYGSYSPFIDVFCSDGDFHKAFMFFLQMVEKGVVPDYLSWNKLLLCLCQQKSWLEGNNKICRLSSQLQIRNHAQKYFLKVQKSGTSEHVPPPRPKRKAAHPCPQKAPKKVVSQVGSIQFQPPGALPEPGFGMGPDSLSVPGNTINFSPWTYDNVPATSTSHMRKDDAQLSSGGVVQNCSSSSIESMPRICTTKESNAQKESKKQMKVMPDFAQVYSFIGSVFDPSTRDHLQRLKKMDPIDVQTALMLMKNLSFNLLSPEFEDHRKLLSSFGLGAEKDKMDHPIKTDFRENAVRAV